MCALPEDEVCEVQIVSNENNEAMAEPLVPVAPIPPAADHARPQTDWPRTAAAVWGIIGYLRSNVWGKQEADKL